MTERAPMEWYTNYWASYTAGESHAFILSGDIEGTAFENVGQKSLLLVNLATTRDIVATWHIAEGIRIYDEAGTIEVDGPVDRYGKRAKVQVTRKERALALVGAGGADTPPAPTPSGPLAALQASLQGAGAPPEADPFAAATRIGDALALLTKLLTTKEATTAVVIDYADKLVPPGQGAGAGGLSPEDRRTLVTLLAWAKDQRISDPGNPIFLLTRDAGALHEDLRASDSGWRGIAIARPDRAARLEYVGWCLDQRAEYGKPVALLDGLAAPEIANLTAGLSLRNIEDILLLASQDGGLSRRLLKRYKDEIVTAEYSEVAEMIDPLPGGFADLGGKERLKAWAYENIIDPVRAGRRDDVTRGVLLVGPPGCLAGDTRIVVNRGGGARTMPIAEVVDRFNGGRRFSQRTWDATIPTYVQRADGDRVRLGRLVAAWASGVKQTYTLTTEGGRTIRATAEHPFLTPRGWRPLGALSVGDRIMVNGGHRRGATEARKRYAATYTRYHPHQRAAKGGFRYWTHRLVAEATINGLAFEEYVHILRNDMPLALTLTYLPRETLVHHIDRDHTNNDPANLEVLDSHAAHAARHEDSARHVLEHITTDAIVAIVPYGEEMTYDLQVADDPHCFVANGFVVHNSGKTEFLKGLAKETGFSAVALNSAKILGGIVGESERKLSKFFAFARSLAPVIVFADEIDQSDMASRGNNSGNPVASNLFNGMLQFMGDESLRGKVIMVFASNRPDLLDPAFKRNGRIDAIIPVLLPDHDERVGMILSQAKRQRATFTDPANVAAALADMTEDWSAADLAAVVRKARMKASGAPIGPDHVAAALRGIRPSGKENARAATMMALEACTEMELLPAGLQALAMQGLTDTPSAERMSVADNPYEGTAVRRPRG